MVGFSYREGYKICTRRLEEYKTFSKRHNDQVIVE